VNGGHGDQSDRGDEYDEDDGKFDTGDIDDDGVLNKK
jgi:hypothetical protein